ncbi:Lsr2 family protein [Streptomyces sp. NPDC004546]|uniref:histone-like nucleoid-structuring protein Lsr2 n=1 Tax=Streptomyces sp. NPDC004546 TaxID=3154282 RepID=UPI0033A344F4
MAERTILVDDLDEETTEGVERVEFSWLGKDYEIDLSTVHVDEYTDLLAPLLKAARIKQAGGRKGSKTKAKTDSAETKRIREWGKANGYEVPGRGPVPANVREAYATAQSVTQEPAVPAQGQPEPAATQNPYAGR